MTFILSQGSWGIDEHSIDTFDSSNEDLKAEATAFIEALNAARQDLNRFMAEKDIHPNCHAHPLAIEKGKELTADYNLGDWCDKTFIARNPEMMGKMFLDDSSHLDRLVPGLVEQVLKEANVPVAIRDSIAA